MIDYQLSDFKDSRLDSLLSGRIRKSLLNYNIIRDSFPFVIKLDLTQRWRDSLEEKGFYNFNSLIVDAVLTLNRGPR